MRDVWGLTFSSGVVWLVASLVWLSTSVATLLAWSAIRETERESASRRVDLVTQHAAMRLGDFLRSRQLVAESLASTYEDGREIDEADFERTARVVHERFEGILSINWIDADGVIVWIHPLERNRGALGKQPREHPIAAPMYLDSLEHHVVRATPPLSLFQGMPGFAVYFPVERHGEHLGMINVVFDTETLIHASLGDAFFRDNTLSLRDGDDGIYTSPDFAQAVVRGARGAQTLGAMDRTWTLEVAPKASPYAALRAGHNLWLGVGLASSLLLSLLVLFAHERHRQRLETTRLQQEAEAKLRAAAKLESLGLLARGLTHDFNNLLGAIQGNALMLREDVEEDEEVRESVDTILETTDRAIELTAQLMAFTHPGHAEPHGAVRLDEFSQRWRGFVRGLAPKSVGLDYGEAPVVCVGMNDSSLARVVTNLVVNAVDAMEHTGQLAISWTVERQGEREFAVLEVRDSGPGMTHETRARIFEPYFTTKPDGAGTGLGLSTIYGLVREVGGAIDVLSRPGEGATFLVSLPVVESA